MRIATYNFLHGGSARRGGHLARLVEATNADIVLCQEARPSEMNACDTFIWRAVPGYRWGSGILVRGQGAKAMRIRGFQGWVAAAEITLGSRLCIVSVHCPAGPGGYVRTMHRVLDVVARVVEGSNLILGGDFNVAAGYRADGEAVKMSRGERELLDRITGDLRLSPCWQTAHTGVPLAQTLRWTANRAAPYHCDGIFIPQSWVPHLTSCDILADAEWEKLSDHNPVVADVAIVSAASAHNS